MMEVVGLAASVITILDISSKVAKYLQDDKILRPTLIAFNEKLMASQASFGKLKKTLLQKAGNYTLSTSIELENELGERIRQLEKLNEALESGKPLKVMRNFGARA